MGHNIQTKVKKLVTMSVICNLILKRQKRKSWKFPSPPKTCLPSPSLSREIIESSGGPRHLSTISLKNLHLFKIAESVINLYLKKKI